VRESKRWDFAPAREVPLNTLMTERNRNPPNVGDEQRLGSDMKREFEPNGYEAFTYKAGVSRCATGRAT
jgi:hypothetical protein